MHYVNSAFSARHPIARQARGIGLLEWQSKEADFFRSARPFLSTHKPSARVSQLPTSNVQCNKQRDHIKLPQYRLKENVPQVFEWTGVCSETSSSNQLDQIKCAPL